LLWGKFIFSTTMMLGFALVLTVFSDLMLHMPPGIILLHSATTLVLAVGLSGMSVGLGAVLVDFRETNPSKIASGFGGTLNSILGLLFLLVTFALMSGPWHLMMAFDSNTKVSVGGGIWILSGAAVGLGVGLAALVVPLHLGIRSIRMREF
jgi:ABC-2 type transport system permease protein